MEAEVGADGLDDDTPRLVEVAVVVLAFGQVFVDIGVLALGRIAIAGLRVDDGVDRAGDARARSGSRGGRLGLGYGFGLASLRRQDGERRDRSSAQEGDEFLVEAAGERQAQPHRPRDHREGASRVSERLASRNLHDLAGRDPLEHLHPLRRQAVERVTPFLDASDRIGDKCGGGRGEG